jgi:mono/diheme cytochrome c family protein
VTEIPEHLLKRSRERRSALGLGGDGGGATESAPAASATPATTSSAAPAPAASSAPAGRAAAASPAAPPPPKPDSPVVAAYKRRKKIPMWAMLALSLLPVWAFMYARAVTTQAVEAAGPLAAGEAVYGGCAGCHGADGGPGNLGYPFAGGEVLKTFPHIEDQLRYVYYGTDQYNLAGVEIYGDPNRDGGPHIAGARGPMPNQGAATGGALTDYELLGVVCHERYTLGGADAGGDYAEEYETWCSEESEIFADLEGGGDIRTLEERFPDIIPIGMAPVPGSPAGE